jgi:hypothetical protein
MEQGISSGVELVFQPGLGLIFVLLHFSFLLHLPREDFGRRTIFRSGVFPLPVLGPLPRIRFSRQSAPPSRFGPHFVPAVESLPGFSSLVRNYFSEQIFPSASSTSVHWQGARVLKFFPPHETSLYSEFVADRSLSQIW